MKRLANLLMICSLTGCLLTTPLNAGARRAHRYHHRRVRVTRVVRRRHRSRQYYLFGTRRHPAFIFNWQNIKHFRNYGGSFRARDAPVTFPVRITSRVRVGNQTFDRIRSSEVPSANGWVAAASISNNPRRGRYYQFRNLVSETLRSEITKQAPRLMRQMKSRTKYDLNRDRSRYGIFALKEDPVLDQLAKIRANQIIRRFSHYDQNGTPETTDDANAVGLSNDFMASENIATVGMGETRLRGDNIKYYNRNGNQMADTDNDGMMYHDELENNGHRQNILSTDSTLVGIGTAYNPRNETFYLAEDFGNHNPDSSEDVDE